MLETEFAKNQYVIRTSRGVYFKSYKSIVAFLPNESNIIQLKRWTWDCSATTLKYLKRFISLFTDDYIVQKKTIENKIKEGKYVVVDELWAI